MYDVEKLFVSQQALEDRGMTKDDLIVDVEVINDEALADLMDDQDVIFSF